MKKSLTYLNAAVLLLIGSALWLSWTPASISSAEDIADLNGAWRINEVHDDFKETWPKATAVKILSDGLFSVAYYELDTKEFIAAGGGTYTLEKGTYTETIEFMTLDSAYVGQSVSFTSKLKKGKKEWHTAGKLGDEALKEVWTRIDDASDSDLTGAWRIRERANREGEMRTMRRGPRKTIKYLSATRFQWAAFNVATKQFMGTGGGTYTLDNGKYTEHIEFFSRDSSRVGMSLGFNYKVTNGDWHHSGKSSRGNPINEIWAIEKTE